MKELTDHRILFLGIERSTIQLLRFRFSFFLMPVFWFAVSQVVYKDWQSIFIIFIVLHLFVYPSSNGYNSYMDRDETSIGGLKNPSKPTRQLLYATIIMDVLAVLTSLLVSTYFSVGIIVYILVSRAYSYRGIRLKKYAVIGYLTVVICQGALVFFLVYHGSHLQKTLNVPFSAMLASSLMVGGFYPLTQVYQHQADLKDGVRTISYLLGFRGTFIFAMIIYSFAFAVLAYYFISSLETKEFFVLATCMVPLLVYFSVWATRVWKDEHQANFENTMKMNLLASCCTNLGFIVVMLMQWN